MDKKMDTILTEPEHSNSFFKLYWKYIVPVPIFMTLIVLNQLYLSYFMNLSHEFGGGYGMFTTISERFSHYHLTDAKSFNCAEKRSSKGNFLLLIIF